jgi:hypothetical protein
VKGSVGAFILIFGYVLLLFVATRPGSQGPTLVSNFGSALTNVITAGTGGSATNYGATK